MRSVLVQTLVVQHGKVLLGRWRPGSGPFVGRLTGALGSVQVPVGQEPPKPEVVASKTCLDLLGPEARVDPRKLRRRGLFHFQEMDQSHGAAKALGDKYSEHQLVLRLRADDAFTPQTTDMFEPVGWFGRGELPFDEMPEDDEVWYDRVLFDDQRLKGSFAFQGTRLLNHELQEVPAEEGLCDLDQMLPNPSTALLLHNPSCSKSRALREALVSKGVDFVERNYLQEPLTLSELETVAARLTLASGASASSLSRAEGLPDMEETVILEDLALCPDRLQRPILIKGLKAALGRPKPEDASWLL